jgi:signal transduction histidine kinase/HAMP domain-containing protein
MLRWRLLIGMVSIFVLLMAVGGYSIWLIVRLQADIDSILKDNYESIREAHNIRIEMLRLNIAYLKPKLADALAVGLEPLEARYKPPFERTLLALRLLSPTEQTDVRKLSDEVGDYLATLRQALTLPPDAQNRYDALRTNLQEKNLALTETTERILAHNESAMIAAQAHANTVAADTVKFLIGAMIAAVGALIYTYHRLGRSLITPIEDLTRSIDAVRAQRFEQSLPIHSNDELGRLAKTFNAMAGELRTYRRDMDETILRLNRSLREAIAAFPYPVILLDAGYEIWVTNEAAEAFLKSIDSPSALPASIRERLEAVRLTGVNYLPEGPREALLFRIGEKETHYLPRILRIFSPEGDVAGAAIILIDVTRFRWLDDMKTNVISTISHEIKTPLTGIRMILHLLLEKSGGDLTEMQEEMVQAACDDCERLLTTLNNLLELSRMEAGRTQLDLQPVPPCDLLNDARDAFQIHAVGRNIKLSVHADEKLPHVLADSARMIHVIGNFTSNALKFAPEHSTVRLTADRIGSRFVRLSVIDAGPGIPSQFHARIFDKFFRTPSHRVEGVGLGLSIAREVVHAHDGRIGVESVPNVATRFYCELPLAS